MSPRAGQFRSIEQRFWVKVRKTEDDDSCWEWTARKSPDGYGLIRLSTARTVCSNRHAHRVSWELHNGPIPVGMEVCHRCDNPGCVRPAHLFLGSSADNQRDKVAKGRQARGARNGNAVLTATRVAELRARFAAGPTNDCHLAREYGVSPTAIRHLRIGLTWRSP